MLSSHAREIEPRRFDGGLARFVLAPGMLTVGWASCTARGVDAPGFDMVMMVACAWRHGAQ